MPLRTGRRGRPRLVEEAGLLMGQAVKQHSKHPVVGVMHRAAIGSIETIEAALGDTGGGKQINTAYIERLNATFRSRFVGLVRHTRSLSRRQELLEAGMWMVGMIYNYCTPYHGLRVEADSGHKYLDGTPTMAAGLIEHVWTMQELLRYQVSLPEWVAPKRRGRPPKQSQQPAIRLAA